GLEEPAVGVEARRIENRVLGAEERRQPPLELLVDVLRAADEADRAEAEAVLRRAVARGLDEPRVVGQPEIVVRAEVQHLAAACDLDAGGLLRGDDALGLVEALLLESLGFLGQVGEKGAAHARLLRRARSI